MSSRPVVGGLCVVTAGNYPTRLQINPHARQNGALLTGGMHSGLRDNDFRGYPLRPGAAGLTDRRRGMMGR